MKLSLPQLHINDKLDEFDFWITPSLGEIRLSARYNEVQSSLCTLIEIIGVKTEKFKVLENLSPKIIATAISAHIKDLTVKEKVKTIESLAIFLFLVTGKTDNNSKCQFPIFLRDIAKVSGFPKISGSKTDKVLSQMDIPREIKSERIAKLIGDLSTFPEKQFEILSQYISFIIDSEHYLRSLWTIGNTYFKMKKVGFEKDFLQPMIIFQVRGSVSASAGHEPEDVLRERMLEWGLKANVDFNNSDIIVKDIPSNTDQVINEKTFQINTGGSIVSQETIQHVTIEVDIDDTAETVIEKVEETIKNKTRAYDFVLPYNVQGWDQKIFIQCQFYAGDSGSVSHKNVDQTRTSRNFVKTIKQDPIFLEYIDGAGYFSSLWGDLKKILEMNDTNNFFQVRTAVIKLRGKLQEIGFLTPLEVVHAWALKNGKYSDILNHLLGEGYSATEIKRVIDDTLFTVTDNELTIENSVIEMSRRYLLLDFIAVKGAFFNDYEKMKGIILVPAFGKFYGIRVEDLLTKVIPSSGKFQSEWSKTEVIFKDIQFLADKGWIAQR